MPQTVRLPGIAQQALHLFLLLDCSGSMASNGKIQALNMAVREALPHLDDVDESNPHAELFLRAIAFSTGARWHIPEPTRLDEVSWTDLAAGGYTDLGSALQLLLPELEMPPLPRTALPPAIILVSDGMPTDEYETVLEALEATPGGRMSLRVAVAIGREADRDTLSAFMGGRQPILASNPEQLADAIRTAAARATQLASTLADWVDLPARNGPVAADPDIDDVVW